MDEMLLPWYVAVLIIYVVLKIKHYYGIAIIFKLIASCIFLVYGFRNWSGSLASPGTFVIAGLVCGLAGDYFLDMKYVTSSNALSDGHTFKGFWAFIIAHVMNAVAIIQSDTGSLGIYNVLLIAALSIGSSAFIVGGERYFGVRYGKFKQISFLYGALLIFVTCASFISGQSDERRSCFYMTSGLISFVLSDLVLSQTFFGVGKNTAPFIIANYCFYYGAQWLIAKSLAHT